MPTCPLGDDKLRGPWWVLRLAGTRFDGRLATVACLSFAEWRDSERLFGADCLRCFIFLALSLFVSQPSIHLFIHPEIRPSGREEERKGQRRKRKICDVRDDSCC